jgi:hypothetical protein
MYRLEVAIVAKERFIFALLYMCSWSDHINWLYTSSCERMALPCLCFIGRYLPREFINIDWVKAHLL